MSPAVAPIESTLPEIPPIASPPVYEGFSGEERRFGELRGVTWRIHLGILPHISSYDDCIELRRVTANSRRRYAGFRKRLLVDPHNLKDGSTFPGLVMDDPLSQKPDSMWGRYFRNAELEKIVDQDLSRLYPEHGSYFQTPGCQSILRRILLLWCLKHPEHSYRQGMHELLAPILYVLHADMEYVSQVQKIYDNQFSKDFDGFTFQKIDFTYDFDFKNMSEFTEDEIEAKKCQVKIHNLDDLDPKIKDVILLSDAYGAEAELGIVLSEKFMEHDAYCMFDALMSGAGGAVSMADFFSTSPLVGSCTGLPPVIEASFSFYHLLSIVDSSLHSHLVELGVEPQYFALRWLRVLFGRELSLENLLIIWEEIFSCDNTKLDESIDDGGPRYGVLCSIRGGFITAFAVSIMSHMRSSLLATENATTCLQKLLNLPENVHIMKLIKKARSLLPLAVDSNSSIPLPVNNGVFDNKKSVKVRGHTNTSGAVSPKTPLNLVPENYWEEKWRDHQKAEELKQRSTVEQAPKSRRGWSEKFKLRFSRTKSATSSTKINKVTPDFSVRRNLQINLGPTDSTNHEDQSDRCSVASNTGTYENEIESTPLPISDSFPNDVLLESANLENGITNGADFFEDISVKPREGDDTTALKEQKFLSRRFHFYRKFGLELEDEKGTSDRRVFEATESPDGEEPGQNNTLTSFRNNVSLESGDLENIETNRVDFQGGVSLKPGQSDDTKAFEEQKLLSDKIQLYREFGLEFEEGITDRWMSEALETSNGKSCQNSVTTSLTTNMADMLRDLGRSMAENIQVIESCLQREQVGKQDSAMAALEELRKISSILSDT